MKHIVVLKVLFGEAELSTFIDGTTIESSTNAILKALIEKRIGRHIIEDIIIGASTIWVKFTCGSELSFKKIQADNNTKRYFQKLIKASTAILENLDYKGFKKVELDFRITKDTQMNFVDAINYMFNKHFPNEINLKRKIISRFKNKGKATLIDTDSEINIFIGGYTIKSSKDGNILLKVTKAETNSVDTLVIKSVRSRCMRGIR